MPDELYPGQMDNYLRMAGESRDIFPVNPASPEERAAASAAAAARETPQQIIARKMREERELNRTDEVERTLRERFHGGEVGHLPSAPREYVDMETGVASVAGEVFPLPVSVYQAIGRMVLGAYKRYSLGRIKEIQDGFMSALQPPARRRRKTVRTASRTRKRKATTMASQSLGDPVSSVRKARAPRRSKMRKVHSLQADSPATASGAQQGALDETNLSDARPIANLHGNRSVASVIE